MLRTALAAFLGGALLAACSTLEPVEGSDTGVLPTGRARLYLQHDEPRAGPYLQLLGLVTQGQDGGSVGAGKEVRVEGQSLFGPADYDIDFDLRLLQVGLGARLAAEAAFVDAELGVESRAGKFQVTSPGYESRLDLDGTAFYVGLGMDLPFGERWLAAFRFSGSMAGSDAPAVVQFDGGVRFRVGAGLELAAGLGYLEMTRTDAGDSDLTFSIFGPRLGVVWGW